MGAKKIKVRKKDSEKAEEILSFTDRLLEWGQKNLTYLLGTLVGILVVVFVVWGVKLYARSKERSALRDYVQLQAVSEQPGKKSTTIEDRLKKFQEFVQAHRGSKVAGLAMMDMARLLSDAGRYEEAVRWYEEAAKALPEDAGIRLALAYGRASALEAWGKTDEALAAWKTLANEADDGLKRECLWHQARLTAKQGDPKAAVQVYDLALKTQGVYPDAELLRAEKQRLNDAEPSRDAG